MFNQKCSKCNNTLKNNYDFCPNCGTNLKSKFDEKDYGLLGKNDAIKPKQPDFLESIGLGGLMGGLPIGKILKGAMKELPSMIKMIEKQMENTINQAEKNQGQRRGMNVQFFVNGKPINPTNNPQINPTQKPQAPKKEISKEKMKLLAKLPKVEPESQVRRLSGKVMYNIQVPGVKNIEDIFINQLESCIEIKAIGKDKVYSKTLNMNLPVKAYDLVNGNLVIELEGK